MDFGNILSQTAGGAVKGGMSGGPEGAAIGAGLSLVTGLMQDYKANKLKQKSDAAFPSLVDPNQASYLAELDQKRRSIEAGSAFNAGMNAIDSSTSGVNDAITRNTGGDVGSTIQSLLMANKNASDAKNNVLAQGQQNQVGYDSMYGNMLNAISARKLQLQMSRSQQALAEWSKMKQGSNQNLSAGAAGSPSILDNLNLGGNANPSTSTGAITDNSGGMQSMNPGMLPVKDASLNGLASQGTNFAAMGLM